MRGPIGDIAEGVKPERVYLGRSVIALRAEVKSDVVVGDGFLGDSALNSVKQVFAVAFDDYLNAPFLGCVYKRVRQPRLRERVQVNLRLLQNDGGAFGRVEAENERGQYLRYAEADIRD